MTNKHAARRRSSTCKQSHSQRLERQFAASYKQRNMCLVSFLCCTLCPRVTPGLRESLPPPRVLWVRSFRPDVHAVPRLHLKGQRRPLNPAPPGLPYISAVSQSELSGTLHGLMREEQIACGVRLVQWILPGGASKTRTLTCIRAVHSFKSSKMPFRLNWFCVGGERHVQSGKFPNTPPPPPGSDFWFGKSPMGTSALSGIKKTSCWSGSGTRRLSVIVRD